MFKVFYGHGTANQTVREYLQRKRMATLGLTSDIGSFPAWKIDAMMYIDCEFDRLAEEKSKKRGKNGR